MREVWRRGKGLNRKKEREKRGSEERVIKTNWNRRRGGQGGRERFNNITKRFKERDIKRHTETENRVGTEPHFLISVDASVPDWSSLACCFCRTWNPMRFFSNQNPQPKLTLMNWAVQLVYGSSSLSISHLKEKWTVNPLCINSLSQKN